MLDLLSVVPYYTAHLVSALAHQPGISIETAAIAYHLDPQCHSRLDVSLPGWPSNRAGAFRAAWPRRIGKTIEAVYNLRTLRRRLASCRPDVLHVQFAPLLALGLPFELQLIRAARRLGIAVVYTVHNVLPHEGGAALVARYRSLYAECDQLICHDEASRHRLEKEFNVRPERIAVIPHGPLLTTRNGLDSATARHHLGIAADSPVVLCQGILRPYKGVDVLIQAWQHVAQSAPHARLIIAGTGEPAIVRDIRQQIDASGLCTSIRLEARFLSVEELETLHQAADILVYPYRAITTSGSLLTGIGYGKAIVATRLPAFSSLLEDGANALLAEPADSTDLGRQLLRLVQQPDLRARLGRAAREVVSWDEIAARTAALYRSLSCGGAQ